MPWRAEAKMNLHRMNQLFYFCLLRWDGTRWGGGDLRSEVIAMCKERWERECGDGESGGESGSESGGEAGRGPSDDDLVEWACTESNFFLGLWRLLDVEVRLAVEPFILWEQGDFRHFLNALPAMCAIIASAHKPKVGEQSFCAFCMCGLLASASLRVSNHLPWLS